MTSLISWIGVDSRAPSSIYLASDSRISWRDDVLWDCGRKLFACHNSPDLFGYVGQVLFPSQVLSQVQSLIEHGLLFGADATPDEKREAVFAVVKSNFETFPTNRDRSFTIVHSTRSSEGMDATFWVSMLSWNGKQWEEEKVTVPETSGIVRAWGSGQTAIDKWYARWMNAQQSVRTSRTVFSAFCDALASEEDQTTGGAPQLVGLYRQGGGKPFGIIYRHQRYFLGVPVGGRNQKLLSKIEWRNSLFELCDGETTERLRSAQKHGRPGDLGRAL